MKFEQLLHDTIEYHTAKCDEDNCCLCRVFSSNSHYTRPFINAALSVHGGMHCMSCKKCKLHKCELCEKWYSSDKYYLIRNECIKKD